MVVAGGDGTVGKVGRRMIGKPTPIAILPLGTANNIARTLGMAGKPLRDLVRSWKDARCVNCDAGVAKGPWGTQNFIEGFGLGLFAETMVQLQTSNVIELVGGSDPPTVLRTVLKILRTQLQQHPPAKVKLRLDGKEISGNYLLLEVQNIRYIGPNLQFHRGADINDGFLDVVLVGSKDRNKLKPYFMKSTPKRTTLTVRRARHVEIECECSPLHIDDLPWPEKKKDGKPKGIEIDIKVHPGALVFLAPQENNRRPRRRG